MRKDDNGCLIAVIACGVLYFVFPLLITICNIEEVVRELKNGVINDTLSSLFSSSILLYLFFALCIAYAVFDENKNRFIAFWEKVLYVIFLNPIVMLYAIFICIVYIFNIGEIKDIVNSFYYFMIALFSIIIFLLLWYHFHNKKKCDNAIMETQNKYNQKEEQLAIEYKRKEEQLARRANIVSERETLLQQTLKSKTPFKQCARLYADFSLVLYNNIEEYLKRKPRPAYKAAENVSICKAEIKKLELEYKELSYKYEYLVDIFPQLKEYFEEEVALLQLKSASNLDSFLDEYDHARDYIPNKEEWLALSTTQRNQLALDRWKKSPKSNWTIGMLYEMHIAHILRNSGYYVIDFGIRRGLNDLGRDIIAQKVTQGKLNTYVIQCKNWSHIKEIHENVICQLYGTTLEYKLSHPTLLNRGVYPLLITSTELSDMAKKFAEKLEVKVKIVRFNLDEFPLIKCNINDGKKIYHLPFDQQYWHTYIDKTGEFYAYTVKEAEDAGFRRAYRWHGKD